MCETNGNVTQNRKMFDDLTATKAPGVKAASKRRQE